MTINNSNTRSRHHFLSHATSYDYNAGISKAVFEAKDAEYEKAAHSLDFSSPSYVAYLRSDVFKRAIVQIHKHAREEHQEELERYV